MQPAIIATYTPLWGLIHRRENQLIQFPLHRILVAVCVSVIRLSFCLSAYVHVKGDISRHGGRAASHFYFLGSMFWSTYQSSRNYSLRHQQMFFLTWNKPFHWYYLASTLFVCACVSRRMCVSVCARQHRPISRMWSAEMAVVGRQWRGNSWCGHNWVTGSVCNLHTSTSSCISPSPSVSILSGGVQEEEEEGGGVLVVVGVGICYGERLTALMHISLTATLPAVTIRKEHMPELGTTSEELLHSRKPLFCRLQFSLKVCIWSDCDSHLNGTEVWLCLTDSNAPQMDPITCLIVATSCLPFFFSQAAQCT